MINPELGTGGQGDTPPSPLATPGGETLTDIHRWEGELRDPRGAGAVTETKWCQDLTTG